MTNESNQTLARGARADITCQIHVFETAKIPSIWYRGELCFPARAVGLALGASEGGRTFVRLATDEETTEGLHYFRLEGTEAGAVYRALVSSMVSRGDLSATLETNGELSIPQVFILLTRMGLDLALMRSRTDLGRRMRTWLTQEVLPSLRATGTYSVSAPQTDAIQPATNLLALRELIDHAIKQDLINQANTQRLNALEAARAELAARQRATEEADEEQRVAIEAVAERVATLPGTMSTTAVADAYGWLSKGGNAYNRAVALACANDGFIEQQLLVRIAVQDGQGITVPEWHLTPEGLARFANEIDPRYPTGRSTIEPNATARTQAFNQRCFLVKSDRRSSVIARAAQAARRPN